MWWLILKSSRDEAYAKFLEEFGPGFEIWRLDRYGIEYNERALIRDEWTIHMEEMGDITLHSEKYRPYLAFVQGMFEEEYPKRHEEIVELLINLIVEKEGHRIYSLLIDKYYVVIMDIMSFFRKKIDEVVSNSDLQHMLIMASTPFYNSSDSKQISAFYESISYEPTRSAIISSIVTKIVDKWFADVAFLRDLNKIAQEDMAQLYYNLFVAATQNSPEKDPHMEVTTEVNDYADRIVQTLLNYANDYLER